MLNRNITRTVLNTTETTRYTQDITGTDLAFVLETTHALYVGYQGRFAARYFQMATASTESGAALTVAYWDGSAWTAVQDLVDQTLAFQQSGFISWTNQTDWQKSNITGTDADLELYWIKITTDTNLSAGTSLRSVINLFSDDAMLGRLYRELVADTRYLPTGKTSFIEQHLSAKNLVVLRLKQRRVIEHEWQIIDINAVAEAATHACAYYIMYQPQGGEDANAPAREIMAAFDREISKISFDVDEDQDGVVDDTERLEVFSADMVRR